MFNPTSRVIAFLKSHKLISISVVLILAGLGYWGYVTWSGDAEETRYVLGVVDRGTITASVSASGQVSALDQIDIKPKVSGELTWIGVKAGDTVRVGQTIAQIDNTSTKQAIADAEQSLTQAKLQYQKDEAQAPIDYEKSLEQLEDAKRDLKTTYNDTYNTLSNTYLDLPSAMTGTQNILYGYDLSVIAKNQWNIDVIKTSSSESGSSVRAFADVAEADYNAALAKYDQSLVDYKTLTRYSSDKNLEALLTSSIEMTTAIAQALQSELNLLDAYVDDLTDRSRSVPSALTTMRNNARSYLSTTNSNLSSLLNQQKALDSTKKTIRDDERNIEIYKIGNPSGENPISLQSARYDLADRERKIQDLKDALYDYVVTALFSGTLSTVSVKRSDNVSIGTIVATLIADERIATLFLNEVDAAKIEVGDKTVIAFDAIEDLTLSGHVVEIDTAGTVSQGVVSYKVKVSFDTQDERVKPGMTVNASIITGVRQNVLTVPSNALKVQNGTSYLQVFDPPLREVDNSQGIATNQAPKQVSVAIGIADDTNVEIISGIEEGRQIIVRINSGSTGTAVNNNTNRVRGFGGPGGGIRF